MKKLEEIGGEEVVFQGEIFEIVKQEMKGGKVFEFARRSPGVRLLVVNRAYEILITEEHRYETRNLDYRLPGGKVFDSLEKYRKAKKGRLSIKEHTRRAARKELREETGLTPTRMQLFELSKAGATIDWDLYYYIVTDYQGTFQNKRPRLGEIITPTWKSFEEVKDLIRERKIQEDRSVGIISRYLMQRRTL